MSKQFKDEKRINIIRVDPNIAGPFFDQGKAMNIAFRAAKHGQLLFVPDNVRFSAYTYREFVEQFEDFEYEIGINNAYLLDYSKYSKYENMRQDNILLTSQAFYTLVGGMYEHQGIHSNLGTMNLWGNHFSDYIARCYAFSEPIVGVFQTTSSVICRDKDLDEATKYEPLRNVIKRMPDKVHEMSAEYLQKRLDITYRSSVIRGFGVEEPKNSIYYVIDGQKFTFDWSF